MTCGEELVRVGYVPYSSNLEHPADRRRLASWARSKSLDLSLESPLDSDILVLSNAANFGYWLDRAEQPVVLDLVDGYLGENSNFVKDFLRNIIRTLNGSSSLKWITYTRHLKNACRKSTAVVVASPEQREQILHLNSNVFVILDNHSEIEEEINRQENSIDFTSENFKNESSPYIFWEGFGYTIKHFRHIAKELDSFLSKNNWSLILVTVSEFPRWGGFLGKVKTDKVIKKFLPKSFYSVKIVPWTLENIVKFGKEAEFSIIPINPRDKFALLKSENKLLSNWHLNVETFFSNIPSYSRVAIAAKTTFGLVEENQWENKLYKSLNSSIERKLMSANARSYLAKEHSNAILCNKWDFCILSSVGKNDD